MCTVVARVGVGRVGGWGEGVSWVMVDHSHLVLSTPSCLAVGVWAWMCGWGARDGWVGRRTEVAPGVFLWSDGSAICGVALVFSICTVPSLSFCSSVWWRSYSSCEDHICRKTSRNLRAKCRKMTFSRFLAEPVPHGSCRQGGSRLSSRPRPDGAPMTCASQREVRTPPYPACWER